MCQAVEQRLYGPGVIEAFQPPCDVGIGIHVLLRDLRLFEVKSLKHSVGSGRQQMSSG